MVAAAGVVASAAPMTPLVASSVPASMLIAMALGFAAPLGARLALAVCHAHLTYCSCAEAPPRLVRGRSWWCNVRV